MSTKKNKQWKFDSYQKGTFKATEMLLEKFEKRMKLKNETIKKVYCHNCKYFKTYSSLINPRMIGDYVYRDRKTYVMCLKNNPIGKLLPDVNYNDPTYKNKNLDCKDYKRKWWKFWIK